MSLGNPLAGGLGNPLGLPPNNSQAGPTVVYYTSPGPLSIKGPTKFKRMRITAVGAGAGTAQRSGGGGGGGAASTDIIPTNGYIDLSGVIGSGGQSAGNSAVQGTSGANTVVSGHGYSLVAGGGLYGGAADSSTGAAGVGGAGGTATGGFRNFSGGTGGTGNTGSSLNGASGGGAAGTFGPGANGVGSVGTAAATRGIDSQYGGASGGIGIYDGNYAPGGGGGGIEGDGGNSAAGSGVVSGFGGACLNKNTAPVTEVFSAPLVSSAPGALLNGGAGGAGGGGAGSGAYQWNGAPGGNGAVKIELWP